MATQRYFGKSPITQTLDQEQPPVRARSNIVAVVMLMVGLPAALLYGAISREFVIAGAIIISLPFIISLPLSVPRLVAQWKR